jgi:RNA polymerase sigma-70 factor (sigma-E family)
VTDDQDPDFAEFAAVQTKPLLGFAHALTANPHDAWDLTQETLARMGERWGRSRFDEPAAYARTVMVRLNIDRIRRLRRELPLLGGPAEEGVVEVVGAADGWLVEALATLSPRQRTALALRYVEDLDVRGIAERMGCSEGTVKSQLSRGTERLREHAREHGPLRATATRED